MKPVPHMSPQVLIEDKMTRGLYTGVYKLLHGFPLSIDAHGAGHFGMPCFGACFHGPLFFRMNCPSMLNTHFDLLQSTLVASRTICKQNALARFRDSLQQTTVHDFFRVFNWWNTIFRHKTKWQNFQRSEASPLTNAQNAGMSTHDIRTAFPALCHKSFNLKLVVGISFANKEVASSMVATCGAHM